MWFNNGTITWIETWKKVPIGMYKKKGLVFTNNEPRIGEIGNVK